MVFILSILRKDFAFQKKIIKPLFQIVAKSVRKYPIFVKEKAVRSALEK